MPDNNKQTLPDNFSLEVTRPSIPDELSSAKILFQEGLNEEAKKKLFQILIISPTYQRAQDLLREIQDSELDAMLSQSIPTRAPHKKKEAHVNIDRVIEKLNADLGLGLHQTEIDPDKENWVIQAQLPAQGHYDLGVAFYEMGCYRDAIRELKTSERKIRIEQTFLGELGVAVVALYTECLVLLDRSYEVQDHLASILNEPDLKHEEKMTLFYVMGRSEEALGNRESARGWYQKVLDVDVGFRDARARLVNLGQSS